MSIHYNECHVIGRVVVLHCVPVRDVAKPCEVHEPRALPQQLGDGPDSLQPLVRRSLDHHLVIGRLQHGSVRVQVS